MMALRHLLSILILPATMTVIVPYLLVSPRPSTALWAYGGAAGVASTGAGIALLGAGLTLVIATIRQFVIRGKGTLAPWDPPKHLVVAGMYRYVRNPMISGVCTIILGEAAALRSPAIFWWALTFFGINCIYIPLLEETGLEERFGEAYRAYKRAVPRWIPRLRPWVPPHDA